MSLNPITEIVISNMLRVAASKALAAKTNQSPVTTSDTKETVMNMHRGNPNTTSNFNTLYPEEQCKVEFLDRSESMESSTHYSGVVVHKAGYNGLGSLIFKLTSLLAGDKSLPPAVARALLGKIISIYTKELYAQVPDIVEPEPTPESTSPSTARGKPTPVPVQATPTLSSGIWHDSVFNNDGYLTQLHIVDNRSRTEMYVAYAPSAESAEYMARWIDPMLFINTIMDSK